MKAPNIKLLASFASTALLLAACGGGTQTSDAPTPTPTPEPPAVSQLVGTAATGAALANAPVAITNSAGASPCEEATITTTALGSYTCTLKDGQTAPFFVVVTDPTGNIAPLVSVATTTPAAGAALTVNATPLTTAILAQLAPDGNALTVVESKTVDATALQAVTANVVTQLQPVLTSIGAPAGYDPFTTSITAATAGSTGNTADMVLDIVKVAADPTTQQLTLSTVDNPTPVPLATASSAGSALPTPSSSVSTLSQGLQIIAQTFEACYAKPTSSRVLEKDDTIPSAQGGPEVTNIGCYEMASETSTGGIEFLHNGYEEGQLFYGMLTSDKMTGAKFSVPEIVAFYPKEAGAVAPALNAYDRATVNLRYVDNQGNPGSMMTVAALLPGKSSTTRPTEWWLVGNQQPVDVGIALSIRRTQQFNPSKGTGFFQNGFRVIVNTKGPGSANLAAARISGPGLPGNGASGTGLVFKVSTDTATPYMDLFSKNGSLTDGANCGGTFFNCPIVWLARTVGITGSDATTYAPNPTTSIVWAQPADGVDDTKFKKGASYKVELFYGTNTTPTYTYHKTLVSDLTPVTSAVNLPWHEPGQQTLAALDPAGTLAGSQTALTVDWVKNSAAQPISTVQATVGAGSYGPSKSVALGASSVVLDNVTVPAFTITTQRAFNFGYRTTDGSAKSAVYTYN